MITKQELIKILKEAREEASNNNFYIADDDGDGVCSLNVKYDEIIELAQELPNSERECNYKNVIEYIRACSHIHKLAQHASEKEWASVWSVGREVGYDDYEDMRQLDDNIGYIHKSRLLKELEKEIWLAEKKHNCGPNPRERGGE